MGSRRKLWIYVLASSGVVSIVAALLLVFLDPADAWLTSGDTLSALGQSAVFGRECEEYLFASVGHVAEIDLLMNSVCMLLGAHGVIAIGAALWLAGGHHGDVTARPAH